MDRHRHPAYPGSKALGFFRDASIAYVFGAGLETDAYFIALVIPSILFLAFGNAIKNVFSQEEVLLRTYRRVTAKCHELA